MNSFSLSSVDRLQVADPGYAQGASREYDIEKDFKPAFNLRRSSGLGGVDLVVVSRDA